MAFDGFKVWITNIEDFNALDGPMLVVSPQELKDAGPIVGTRPPDVDIFGMTKPSTMVPEWNSYGFPGTSLLNGRTAYKGYHGAFGVYHRYHTGNILTPPFEFTGRMKIHGWKQPHEFEWGGTAAYKPAVVFHVMHKSNNENLVVGLGRPDQEVASVSAEVNGRYGFRTGYTTRVRNTDPTKFGQWHQFRSWVKSYDEWGIDIDGAEVVHVVEKNPPTMSGRVGVGLRLDFFDVEFADMLIKEWA